MLLVLMLLTILGVPARESELVAGGSEKLSNPRTHSTAKHAEPPATVPVSVKQTPRVHKKADKPSSGKSVRFAEKRSVRLFDRKTRNTIKNYNESATTENTDPALPATRSTARD